MESVIDNSKAELRRSPRVNGDKRRPEIPNGPKDMGENSGCVGTNRRRQSQKQKRKDSS